MTMFGMHSRGRAGVLRLGVVAAAVPLLAGCWRQAGVDATHTWSNGSETGLTTANVGSLKPVWTVDLGTASGEPILADGRIYVNEITSDAIFVHDGVRALDAATGATVWQRALADSDLDLNVVMRGTTPAVVGDEVWSSFQVGESNERGTRCAQSRVRLDA